MKTDIKNNHSPLADSVVRQAIIWRIRLDTSKDVADLSACEYWRSTDPTHELAWQRLEHIESTFHSVANRAPKQLHSTLLKIDNDCKNINRRKALKIMAGSALSISAISGLTYQQGILDKIRADYYTANGERSSYTLQDNSLVWLNSDSAIKLNFNSKKRLLHLTRGEMNLNAAADPRPFQVAVPQGLLTAKNSQFLVRNASDHTLLQVVNGRVTMQPKQSETFTEALAGQVYKITYSGITLLNEHIFDYSSWIDDIFSVRDMPLKALLAELSRYRSGYLRCDSSLNNFLISGVFQLRDTDLILQTLARSVQAKVRYLTPWWAEITPISVV